MTSRIPLAIDVAADLTECCRALAAKSSAVQLTDDPHNGSALLTDRAESAIAAINADCKVLVLNPFALSTEDCQCLENSRAAMPAHTARFQPSIHQVQQALATGKLGEPGLLRIHCWNATADRPDSAARELDLALWIFGGSPNQLFATERPGYLQIHLGFDNGGMALIDLDAANPGETEYYSLSMIGSTGAAYADDHHNLQLFIGKHSTQTLLTSQADAALAATIHSFVTAVQEGRTFLTGWRDTLAAQQAVRQARTSAEQQRAVAGGTDA